MVIADEVAGLLAAAGIRRAYGLPGEDHMNLLHALGRAGIDYHPAGNESSAAIMAATDAQLTGGPGLLIASMAPGLSNAANGILHAAMDQIPLLVFSGQHPAAQLPLVVRQGFDNQRLLQPMVKWSARLAAGTDLAAVLGKATDLALAPPAGPVFIELADEVATAAPAGPTGRDGTPGRLASRADRPPTARLVADPAETARLADRLARAARPALVIAGRTRTVRPETAATFSARLRCPTFTTSAQKGLLGAADPYFAGTFLHGNLEAALLGRSDLVVFVSPDPFDYYNRPWGYDAETVAVSADPVADWLHPATDRLHGDPEAVLRSLAAQVTPASQWQPEEIGEYRRAVRASLLGGGPGLSVPAAVDAVLRACPNRAYLAADAGFSKPLVALLSQPEQPGHYFASHGLSTMGFTIPAGLALARAQDAPTVGFLGDGSLLMRATELAFAKDLAGPLVVVAIMDRALTQIAVKQERRGLDQVGAAVPEISCHQLAETLGIQGTDVATAADLTEVVDQACARRGATLIGAFVDPDRSRQVFEVLRG